MPIERGWAALENYWNGTILTIIDDALRWAANMTWNGVSPLVNLVNGDYPKKIKVSADELEPYTLRSRNRLPVVISHETQTTGSA